MGKSDDIQQDIHEWGKIERDLAELADYSRHGGWLYRLWKWMEGVARRERQELIAERDEDRAALSQGEDG